MNPTVTLETSLGTIEIELFADKAPTTVDNFLSYINSGHYDGTIFHRVINNFMIQGGGFTEAMEQKPVQAPIQNEANNGVKNVIGTIAMARTSDPHSATAQFFINVKDNDFLNFRSESSQGWGYTVFGKVVKGMETVESIKIVKTGRRKGHDDVPLETIVIQRALVKGGSDGSGEK